MKFVWIPQPKIQSQIECETEYGSLHISICILQFACFSFHITVCLFQFAFCGLHITVCILQLAYCSVHIAVCKLQFAYYSLHISVCILQFAYCSLHFQSAYCRLLEFKFESETQCGIESETESVTQYQICVDSRSKNPI